MSDDCPLWDDDSPTADLLTEVFSSPLAPLVDTFPVSDTAKSALHAQLAFDNAFLDYPLQPSTKEAQKELVEVVKERRFVVDAVIPPAKGIHRKPGYCYTRLFPRRCRSMVSRVLGPGPTCAEVATVLVVVYLGRRLECFRPSAAFTFDPLHLEAFRPSSWTWSEVTRVLVAFSTQSLGAPRANFSNAMDLLSSTIHKDAVLDVYTAPVMRSITDSQRVCPNKLSDPVFALLQSKGLPVDNNATGSHPHPGMKALEEHMLSTVAHQMPGDCTVAFMKLAKFNRLQRRNARFTTLSNPILTVKDQVRFGGVYSRLGSPITTPNLFLHDCGHYLTPGEVAALFHRHANLERIFFTAILPDELMTGEPSWHAPLYRLQKLDSSSYAFILSEDGESYEHPYSTLAWLKTDGILAGWETNVSHSVDITAKVCAHKLFCVTRNQAPVSPGWYVADSPDDIILPEVDGRVYNHSAKRVPRKVFQSVLLHSQSLSTQRYSSTLAKVRTFQGNSEYSHIEADTWITLAQVCYALSLDPATLEREAAVNSYASLALREMRRFMHRHEWLQPCLTALGVTVSWGSLLLPVFGIQIPDLHVRPGLTIPGWTYGAVASLASQVVLVAMGQSSPGAATWALRSAALVLPHLAYLLPDFTFSGGFTIPSFVGGILSSIGVTGALAVLDGHGSHYEVRDFISRMPIRENRTWAMELVQTTYGGRCLEWHFASPNGDPPPPYDPLPPADPPSPSHNPNPHFNAASHGSGGVPAPEWHFVDTARPGFARTLTTDATSSFLRDDLISLEPRNVPLPSSQPSECPPDEVPLPSSRCSTIDATPDAGVIDPAPPEEVPLPPSRAVSPHEQSSALVLAPRPLSSALLPSGTRASGLLTTREARPYTGCAAARPATDLEAAQRPALTALPAPQPAFDPMAVFFPPDEEPAFQFADPAAVGLSPAPRASDPLGPPLRHRFGLAEDEVLELDATLFSCCPLPSGATNAPMPVNHCLITSVSRATGLGEEVVWDAMWPHLPEEETVGPLVETGGLSVLALIAFCYQYGTRFRILGDLPNGHPDTVGMRHPHGRLLEVQEYRIYVSPGHWSASPPQLFRGAAPTPLRAKVLPCHRRPKAFEAHLAAAVDFTGRPVTGRWKSYDVSAARAKAYIRDLKAGTTGTIRANEGKATGGVPADWTARMDSMVDNYVSRRVLMTAVLGAPGSSKSSGLVPVLQEERWLRDNTWKLAVPRVKLRQAWTRDLKLGGKYSWKVGTFETNLFKTATTLIVDEVSQFPPGYIDLALISNPRIESVVVIGDVTQGDFHEPHADATLNEGGSEAQYFRDFCDEYRLFSNSIPRAVSSALGLPTRSKTRGFITLAHRAEEAYPVVCASDTEMRTYANLGYTAYTFGTVQGQRFPTTPIQIIISNATAGLVSRGHFCSALCRSNIGVYLIVTGTQQAVRSLSADPFLSSLFCGTTRLAYADLFAEELRGLPSSTPTGLWDPLAIAEVSVPAFQAQPLRRVTLFRGASEDPGFCYLALFPPTAHVQARRAFGAYPTLGTIVEFVTQALPRVFLLPPATVRTGFVFYRGDRIEVVHIETSANELDNPWPYLQALSGVDPDLRVGHDGTLDLPLERASDPLRALMNPCPEELPKHIEHDRSFQRGPPTAAFDESEEYLKCSFGELPAREDREEYETMLQSDQFRDATPFVTGPSSSGLEQFFPRHRADDLLTFKRTVEKRLRFCTQQANRERYSSRMFTGPILFNGWCRTTGVDPACIPSFNEKLYAECIFENDFTKLTQKTQATLLNNAERADPDWRFTFVRIFMKSQLKVKMETVLSPFKAGQTIASFHDSVILITGPMTRYLCLVDEKLYAPEYYYHPGHSPLELSTWCANHWKDVPANSTNDYTAFDQSQTGEALALETILLRAHHIPDLAIEYYIDLKLNLSCQFGELAVMRFTGEGPTLRFNSDFNAALIGVQYIVEPGVGRCVAGDDMAINGVWQVRPGWDRFRRFLTIVAKPETVRTAAFCSWLLTSHGAMKEPRTVFAKLMIARDRGEEARVLPNLLNEVAVGYHLGDHVYSELDDLTLATHFWLVRYFVTHAPLRFRLLLATRSVEDTLARIWSSIDNAVQADLLELSARLGEMWMLQSRPARLAASLLSRVGGFALSRHKIFDAIVTTAYRF